MITLILSLLLIETELFHFLVDVTHLLFFQFPLGSLEAAPAFISKIFTIFFRRVFFCKLYEIQKVQHT